jgi:hypothetical protein
MPEVLSLHMSFNYSDVATEAAITGAIGAGVNYAANKFIIGGYEGGKTIAGMNLDGHSAKAILTGVSIFAGEFTNSFIHYEAQKSGKDSSWSLVDTLGMAAAPVVVGASNVAVDYVYGSQSTADMTKSFVNGAVSDVVARYTTGLVYGELKTLA